MGRERSASDRRAERRVREVRRRRDPGVRYLAWLATLTVVFLGLTVWMLVDWHGFHDAWEGGGYRRDGRWVLVILSPPLAIGFGLQLRADLRRYLEERRRRGESG